MSKTEISKQISSNKQASHGVRRSSVCIIGLALFLALAPSVARAQGTADQRAACTLDAFRLCGAEIPNVERIIACMKANKANLSPGCRSVFDKTSFLPRLAPDLLNPRVRQFARDGVNPEKCADQVQNSAPSNDIGARVLKRGARKSGERLR